MNLTSDQALIPLNLKTIHPTIPTKTKPQETNHSIENPTITANHNTFNSAKNSPPLQTANFSNVQTQTTTHLK